MVADTSSGALHAPDAVADMAMLCVTSPGWCSVAEHLWRHLIEAFSMEGLGVFHDMAVWLQLSWHFDWLTNSTS